MGKLQGFILTFLTALLAIYVVKKFNLEQYIK